MTKSKQAKEQGNSKVMLHARVFLRNGAGEIFDVTRDDEDYGYGLKSLARMGLYAADEIVRITELLDVLALAAENRSQIDAGLVRRVLEEVSVWLDQSGDLASYVRHSQELFEQAEALPPSDATEKRTGRLLVKAV